MVFWSYSLLNILVIPLLTIGIIAIIKRKTLFSTVDEKYEKKGIPKYKKPFRKKDIIKKFLLYCGLTIFYIFFILFLVYIDWRFLIFIRILNDIEILDRILIILLYILSILGLVMIIVGISIIKNDERWYAEAVGNFDIGAFNEAIFLLNRVLEINPNSEQAWYLLGASYYNIDYYDEALEACNRCIEINSNYDYAKILIEKIQNRKS